MSCRNQAGASTCVACNFVTSPIVSQLAPYRDGCCALVGVSAVGCRARGRPGACARDAAGCKPQPPLRDRGGTDCVGGRARRGRGGTGPFEAKGRGALVASADVGGAAAFVSPPPAAAGAFVICRGVGRARWCCERDGLVVRRLALRCAGLSSIYPPSHAPLFPRSSRPGSGCRRSPPRLSQSVSAWPCAVARCRF